MTADAVVTEVSLVYPLMAVHTSIAATWPLIDATVVALRAGNPAVAAAETQTRVVPADVTEVAPSGLAVAVRAVISEAPAVRVLVTSTTGRECGSAVAGWGGTVALLAVEGRMCTP